MKNRNKQLEYSCVLFYSFAGSFFILGIVNIFCPISNFKITILSVVAVLLSLQQLFEVRRDVANKISDLEMTVAQQTGLLELIDPSLELPHPPKSKSSITPTIKSQQTLAAAMILLIVGLTLDFDFQNDALANTSTILSFAVIFFTMGYKERFATRINYLTEAQAATNQSIIDELKKEISSLRKS